jgi:hypothetical protein
MSINFYLVYSIVIDKSLKWPEESGQQFDMVHKEPVCLLQLFDNTLCIEIGATCSYHPAYVVLAILDELTHS